MDGGRGCGDVFVDAFAQANLISFTAWDAIVYLQRHPEAHVTVVSLGVALARPETDVAPVLERFAQTKLVERTEGSDGIERCRLSTDAEVRRVAAKFVEMAAVRTVRLEFVRHVMSRLAS